MGSLDKSVGLKDPQQAQARPYLTNVTQVGTQGAWWKWFRGHLINFLVELDRDGW